MVESEPILASRFGGKIMDNFIRGSLYETVQHLASGPGVRRPVELSSAKAFVAHQLNDHRLDKLRKLFKGIKKDNKKGKHNFICP